VLLSRTDARRPVTLLGYSMGARVVFFCLQELAARSALGVVADGTHRRSPVHSRPPRLTVCMYVCVCLCMRWGGDGGLPSISDWSTCDG
jgi:pimeloyl-ACP methyl ester carboxylesterase